MLARLPKGDYAYELKWDGFCCLVSTVGATAGLTRCGNHGQWSCSPVLAPDPEPEHTRGLWARAVVGHA
jgi:hypothetical protein